jgi:hypothetical protein
MQNFALMPCPESVPSSAASSVGHCARCRGSRRREGALVLSADGTFCCVVTSSSYSSQRLSCDERAAVRRMGEVLGAGQVRCQAPHAENKICRRRQMRRAVFLAQTGCVQPFFCRSRCERVIRLPRPDPHHTSPCTMTVLLACRMQEAP